MEPNTPAPGGSKTLLSIVLFTLLGQLRRPLIAVLRSRAIFPRLRLQIYFFSAPAPGRVGNSLIEFRSELLIFCQKSEWMSDLLKKLAISSFAYFWWVTSVLCSLSLIPSERPERFAHFAQKEWAKLLLYLKTKNLKKTYKIPLQFFRTFLIESLIFFLTERENE